MVGLQKKMNYEINSKYYYKYNINTMRFWVLMLRLLFRRMMRLGKYSTSYWIWGNGVGYFRISRRFLHQAIGRIGLQIGRRYMHSLEVIDTT